MYGGNRQNATSGELIDDFQSMATVLGSVDSDMDGDKLVSRTLGGLFLVGFDGTTLNHEIRDLIENHFVGAILLTSKNLKSADQAVRLICSLQQCAYQAGHKRPLMIAIDQENGSINSLVDDHITQFPSAMGMAAAASPQLTQQVAFATATELRCVGINWILGPVLDVLSAHKSSLLGVRAFGDDPATVLAHGLGQVHGFHEARVACCGKHFPSYGEADFADGSEYSLPVIDFSTDELRNRASIPFRACTQADVDAILVGGCALKISGETIEHACLEENVVSGILRHDYQFKGVILSECLAMEALCEDIGISQGVTMAVRAGCDMITICHSFQAQLEGISALKLAIKDRQIPLQAILASHNRIAAMKDRWTSWDQALKPPGPASLVQWNTPHSTLSSEAYRGAISLVRDTTDSLLRIRKLSSDAEILLLSPLIGLFPSTATRQTTSAAFLSSRPSNLGPGEEIFQAFGALLAQQLEVRLLHTSYSGKGIRPVHESLISRASAVITLTADAVRNTYQYGVTKHVNMQCKHELVQGCRKPSVVVALSSPQDFLNDNDIGTYICTYDFTEPSLKNLASLLAGTMEATNMPPLAPRPTISQPAGKDDMLKKWRWFVERYDHERDHSGVLELLSRTYTTHLSTRIFDSVLNSSSNNTSPACFIIRNSSTNTVLGLALTSKADDSVSEGGIELVLVDPSRKALDIEESLRQHALSYLQSIRSRDM